MTEPQPDPAFQSADPAPTDEPWPQGMPYTVYFPGDGGVSAADLEHPAHLPRVGDVVDYIDHEGAEHRYRVREVVHTLQASATHEQGQVRAGLPKVFLEDIG